MKKFGIVVLSFLVSFSLISATLAADLFEKDIKYGVANNNDVKQLQDFLYNEGFYKGPVTGNFYTLTRNALKKYQLANKITPANGLLNSATREKLNSTLLAQENASEEVLGSDDVSYTADDEAARLAWVARMNNIQSFSTPQTNTVFENKQPVQEVIKTQPIPQTTFVNETPEQKQLRCEKEKENELNAYLTSSRGEDYKYYWQDFKFNPDYNVIESLPVSSNSLIGSILKDVNEQKTIAKERYLNLSTYIPYPLEQLKSAIENSGFPIELTNKTCLQINSDPSLNQLLISRDGYSLCFGYTEPFQRAKDRINSGIETYEGTKKLKVEEVKKEQNNAYQTCLAK